MLRDREISYSNYILFMIILSSILSIRDNLDYIDFSNFGKSTVPIISYYILGFTSRIEDKFVPRKQ